MDEKLENIGFILDREVDGAKSKDRFLLKTKLIKMCKLQII